MPHHGTPLSVSRQQGFCHFVTSFRWRFTTSQIVLFVLSDCTFCFSDHTTEENANSSVFFLLFTEEWENSSELRFLSSEVSFHSSEEFFRSSVEHVHFLRSCWKTPPWILLFIGTACYVWSHMLSVPPESDWPNCEHLYRTGCTTERCCIPSLRYTPFIPSWS